MKRSNSCLHLLAQSGLSVQLCSNWLGIRYFVNPCTSGDRTLVWLSPSNDPPKICRLPAVLSQVGTQGTSTQASLIKFIRFVQLVALNFSWTDACLDKTNIAARKTRRLERRTFWCWCDSPHSAPACKPECPAG